MRNRADRSPLTPAEAERFLSYARLSRRVGIVLGILGIPTIIVAWVDQGERWGLITLGVVTVGIVLNFCVYVPWLFRWIVRLRSVAPG